MNSHIKITLQGQGHCSKGSRSLAKVMSYSIAGCEIPSLTGSFLVFICLYLCFRSICPL